MGYRVEYDPVSNVRSFERQSSRKAALTAFFLLVFFLLVGTFWTEGATVIRCIIFPGDPVVTAAALDNLTADLRAGETVAESLRNFCRMILEGAGFAAG